MEPLASTLSPLQTASLGEQISLRLRTMILHRQLVPGTRLVELELAGQLQTSQGSVRDALQRLEQEGLVERRGRRGTYVTEVSADEMRAIFAVRSSVEGHAIRATAQRATMEQLGELSQLIDLMRVAGQRADMGALADHDMAFHRCICTWSGNSTLLRAWVPLYMQVERFVIATHPRYFHNLTEIADTHQPILAALHARDSALAEAAIQHHIMLIWSRIGEALPPASAT